MQYGYLMHFLKFCSVNKLHFEGAETNISGMSKFPIYDCSISVRSIIRIKLPIPMKDTL